MICSKCGKDNAELVTPCGHRVHILCLQHENLHCPECKRVLSNFQMLWDILRDSGMNPSEEFYKELSGCSDWMRGLAIWLINNDRDGLQFEKIQVRVKKVSGADYISLFLKSPC